MASKTAEVAVVEAEVVEVVTLTKADAERLDGEIRSAAQKVGSAQALLVSLMAEAAEGQIHVTLGYRSISDYFAEAVQISPADAAERKLLAAMMNQKGLSQRAIAAGLGVSVGTINSDLSDVDKGETISTDGRTFKPAGKSEPEAEDATDYHGQVKALAKARKAVAGAAEALAEAFGDGSHYDADITPDQIKAEVKEIRAAWSDVLATFKIITAVK